MLSLRKIKPGAGNVELIEVEIPSIQSDEVLMKVWAALIAY